MKRKLIAMVLITALTFSACGKSDGNEKKASNSANEESVSDSSDEEIAYVDESDDESYEDNDKVSDEDDLVEVVPENKEITIDGKLYIECAFEENEEEVKYTVGEYTVMAVTKDEKLAGTLLDDENLYNDNEVVPEDEDRWVDFDVAVARDGAPEVKYMHVNIDNPESQLGDSEKFSSLCKEGEYYTVAFGKGYFDEDRTLYIDVYVAGEGREFSSTVEVQLRGKVEIEKDAAEPKDVEINGAEYIECDLDEDMYGAVYRIDDYAVIVATESKEFCWYDLELDEDNKTASFEIQKRKDKMTLGYETITIDLENLKEQFGYTDLGEFSAWSRECEDCEIWFGKAYYDKKKTMYVDILINTDRQNPSTTIVSSFKIKLE